MRGLSRKLAVVLAVMGVLAALTGSVVPGHAAAVFPLPDVGVVRLHMVGTDQYERFDPSNGSGGYTAGTPAAISVSKCNASVGGPLSITTTPAPPTGALGFFDDEFGVQVKGEGTGTPCGRVDGTSQALTLQLTGALATNEFDFAELDVEVKFGGTVRAELYFGTQLVRVETLATSGVADSGPDSADGDNYRFRLPAVGATAVFNKIVLKLDPSTPGGAFSLAGGNDGTTPQPGGLGATLNTSDSLFHITDVDGTLNCGDTVTRGTSGVPVATLTRLANGLGGCVAVPYLLRTGFNGADQQVQLQKDLGNQASLQPAFTMSTVWAPEPATYPVVRTTRIDYGAGEQPMQWCNGTASMPMTPSGQAWCITGQSVALVGTGQIQVTESYYGAGDPKFIR
jgi:hypothetical protein